MIGAFRKGFHGKNWISIAKVFVKINYDQQRMEQQCIIRHYSAQLRFISINVAEYYSSIGYIAHGLIRKKYNAHILGIKRRDYPRLVGTVYKPQSPSWYMSGASEVLAESSSNVRKRGQLKYKV